ncbi:hypothetical protein HanPI659440_Chr08g0302341 [Helianthus annuus]|nr:hypothetical protein HanPI659440_Chr08g0302341 [Helianthus annuus]
MCVRWGRRDRLQKAVENGDGPEGVGRWSGAGGRLAGDVLIPGSLRIHVQYPGLYGSDDRMQACMSELNVPLTKEPGFHQNDVYGNLLGLLSGHQVTPLVSLHHFDVIDPIFPGMERVESVKHLLESTKYDSASLIQQSICYDTKREWSVLVSWGFAIQITRGILSPRELETPSRTFVNWYKVLDFTAYAFNTRPVTHHPCQAPFVFYINSTRYDESRRQIIGIYSVHRQRQPKCRWKMASPEKIHTVVVLKHEDPDRWSRAPRKDCCRVLPSRKEGVMYLWVGHCGENEVIEV